MMAFTFIHTADLHLNATLSHASFKDTSAQERRVYELRQTFDDMLEKSKEWGVDALFLAGDVFDDPYMRMHEFDALMDRLSAIPCEVFLVVGNHDAFLKNKTFKKRLDAAGVRTFTPEAPLHRLSGYEVAGSDTWDFSIDRLQAVAENLDGSLPSVLVLHGEVRKSEDEHFLTDAATLDATPFDYVALGHIHQHAFLTEKVAYSGNPEPLDFSESGEKGFIYGEIDDAGLKTQFIPFQRRFFLTHTLTLTPEDTLDSITRRVEALKKEDPKKQHFHRIELKGETHRELDIDTEVLHERLKEDFHHIEFKDVSEPAVDLQALRHEYEDTVVERLIEDFESDSEAERDYESLIEAVRALLATEEDGR